MRILALALDRLTADIEAAEYVSANQWLDPYFEGTSNSIVFVRTTLSPNARPSLEFVRFAEVRSANGPVLVRTEAPFRIFRNNSINSGKSRFENPVVLVRAPYRVSFAYSSADRVWHDIWDQETFLPHSVRLTVEDAQSRRPLAASTAISLHLAVPADCLKAKSLSECVRSHQSNADGLNMGGLGPQTSGKTL